MRNDDSYCKFPYQSILFKLLLISLHHKTLNICILLIVTKISLTLGLINY